MEELYVSIFILFILFITMIAGMLISYFHFKNELNESESIRHYFSNRFRDVALENEDLKERISDIRYQTRNVSAFPINSIGFKELKEIRKITEI